MSIALLSACQQQESTAKSSTDLGQTSKPTVKSAPTMNNSTLITVNVKYLEIEGGFYGLVTDSGKKLLPMNLAPEYKKPGTVLKVKGQELTDVMTTQQWGTPFNITEVELIKLGDNSRNNSNI
ncbi:hypothetical protein LP316_01600 [Thalassotalea sp. LPB0316]|uniref:hypothetical protein n=1 Tax=Thalassotalea sp. LPB0316 TaxID=2769490 RepID=UPI001865ECDC|nr:hypothetical protein [Thalassotalea sp. LPB0316]QOL26030.1 hypothetical protein LP316_01600 [Thalassotalea sp. LPB0316]